MNRLLTIILLLVLVVLFLPRPKGLQSKTATYDCRHRGQLIECAIEFADATYTCIGKSWEVSVCMADIRAERRSRLRLNAEFVPKNKQVM